MLVSIITVVYNSVQTLETTLLSVINQTYDSIEYIIIDGGSSDGTIDIIKKYEDKISFWISEPDKGIYDAINKGVSKANGDWILFLGADDTLYDVIDDMAHYFKDKNTIYYGNAYMSLSKISYAGEFNQFKIAHQNICHQAIFYPRSVFSEYLFNINNTVFADYELNLRLHADKRFKFKFIDKLVCEYSETGFSTFTYSDFYDKGRLQIVWDLFPFYVYYYAKVKHSLKKILLR